MKTTRNQWATIALFFLVQPSLSAQNSWTPFQKQWSETIIKLLMVAKKCELGKNTAVACAVSNEITIVVAPCADAQKQVAPALLKPAQ